MGFTQVQDTQQALLQSAISTIKTRAHHVCAPLRKILKTSVLLKDGSADAAVGGLDV